jgi:FKBP-type peptidyl-prolyl cis-trans isomerase SlpA
MSKVKAGDTIKVHYTGKLEDGSVFDTSLSDGREPLVVTLGETPLITGFVNGLYEMSLGDKKTIEIEPEDAYGDPIPELISEVAKTQVPEGVKVGEMLQAMAPNGTPVNVTVTNVTDEFVTVDANHPLAGKKLFFEVEVLEVEGIDPN